MRVRFADIELVRETRELFASGILRPVEPQVFDLLLYLIEARDRVVSTDDLIVSIWGGHIVSDAAISAARAAIDDDGKCQQWNRTAPRMLPGLTTACLQLRRRSCSARR